MLSEQAKMTLLQIVKDALLAALEGRSYTPPAPTQPELQQCCGCFVTYKTGTALRGCLGCFTAQQPLYQTVAAYAAYSATEDPRFVNNRLAIDDLSTLHLDISILSPLQPCSDPAAIILGQDGIYLQHGGRSGCFLPQVATETGWNVDEFWGNCCSHKAGLPYDAWRQPGIKLFTFTAEVVETAYRDLP